MRVDLLLTDRPITPSGTGRAAPRLCWSGAPTDGSQMQSCIHVISSQAEDPGASEITKDQPFGGGPSRNPNNIIGVLGYASGRRHTLTCERLSPVNGEWSHHAHRCSSVMPAIRAIRSNSAGHTYRKGAVNSRKLPSGLR